MLRASLNYADVVLCCDADERFSRSFLCRLHILKHIAFVAPSIAFSVRVRELWGSPDKYRCDGIWGKKRKSVLFALSEDMTFDKTMIRRHHIPWYHDGIREDLLLNDELFHLKMIRREDRVKRFNLYETLDPNHEMQSIGYSYLIDERGLLLKTIGDDEYDRGTI